MWPFSKKKQSDADSEEILPLLCSWADMEFARIKEEGGGSEAPHSVRLAEHLAFIHVAPDGAGGFQHQTAVSLETDPIEMAGVLLRAHRPAEFTPKRPGTFVAQVGDGFDSSRLLLIDEILSLDLKGEPVAVAPHRNALCVTGSEDVDGLRHLLDVARSAFESERPTSARPVCLRARTWGAFELSADHPLFAEFRELDCRELHGLYGAQRDLLTAAFDAKGDETYLTPLDVGKGPDGSLVSFCTWTGVVEDDGIASELLLPMADKIQIILVKDREPEQMVGMADAAAVKEVCAPLLEATDYSPARVRTLGFPTESMIEKLSTIAPP